MNRLSLPCLLALVMMLTGVAVRAQHPTAPASPAATRPVPWLVQLGIERDNRKLAAQMFHLAARSNDLAFGVGYFVSETDQRLRQIAADAGKSPQSIANLAGSALEYSLLVALLQHGRQPLFWQAEFAEIPNNFYDIVLFTREHGPVVISPKTSLRERYKQADLEALALRGVSPDSRFYLVTLDPNKKHVANVQRKIAKGEVRGIRRLYSETDLDALFREIADLTVVEPPTGTLRQARRIPALP